MRIETLTFFRFIAAISVVIFHFGKSTELATTIHPLSISGPQMVTFFFTLSGFVLMVSHYYKKNETLKSFYILRLARIVPLYILGLFLMVYFEHSKGHNNMTAFSLSVTFLQSWIPHYPLTFNIPAWSLSVEIFFYLTFPFLIFIIKKSEISPLKLSIYTLIFYIITQIILSTLIMNIAFSHTLKHFIDYFPLAHYCSFILGVTAGYIYLKNSKYFLNTHILSVLPMLLILFLLYYLLNNEILLDNFFETSFPYNSSFYAVIFTLLILSISYTQTFVTKLFSLPFFILLGEGSYALYILQQPLHISYYAYLSPHISIDRDEHFYLLLLTLISILVFSFIEKPFNKIIKSYFRTKE